jgi:hypothetical protein
MLVPYSSKSKPGSIILNSSEDKVSMSKVDYLPGAKGDPINLDLSDKGAFSLPMTR